MPTPAPIPRPLICSGAPLRLEPPITLPPSRPRHLGPVGAPNARPIRLLHRSLRRAPRGFESGSRPLQRGGHAESECCFPTASDSLLALQMALKLNPRLPAPLSTSATYGTTNAKSPKPRPLGAFPEVTGFPTVHATWPSPTSTNGGGRGMKAMEWAFALDRSDARAVRTRPVEEARGCPAREAARLSGQASEASGRARGPPTRNLTLLRTSLAATKKRWPS